jgi:hypothetical protein
MAKGKGRKGKKQSELPLVRPEPPAIDEAEATILWDRVGAIQPNPLAVGGPDYNFGTKRAFDAGPPPASIVGMYNPVVPLLGNRAALAAASGGVTSSGDHTASSPGSINGSFSVKSPFAPRPPPRVMADDHRANYHLHKTENEMRNMTYEVTDHLESHRGFWLMMTTELFEFACQRKQLVWETDSLESQLNYQKECSERKSEEQDYQFDKEKYRLEALMDTLVSKDEEVQAALQEKRETLDELRQRRDEIFELQRAHTNNMKQLTKDLASDRSRLDDLMNQRLSRTAEEMSKLTTTQREERQKRAQEESNRLVSELVVLEKRSKHLNDRSMKLQLQSDATRRDRELEQHRRTLLIDKNHGLGEQVKKIVGELQQMEQRVAERQLASAAGLKVAHELAMDRVDQQYESIAYLRTELEKVRADTEFVRSRIREAHRHLLADAGSKHLPISIPNRRGGSAQLPPNNNAQLAITSSPHPTAHPTVESAKAVEALRSLNEDTTAAIRAVVLESLRDTNDAMRRLPIHGCCSIHDLNDPQERNMVQKYTAKRVSKLLSCIYPSAPPFSFLKSAAQNPSVLTTSL